jgi:hypothetical protein
MYVKYVYVIDPTIDLFNVYTYTRSTTQVGLLTVTDLVAKVGFCFYLLSHLDEGAEAEEPINTSSQQVRTDTSSL